MLIEKKAVERKTFRHGVQLCSVNTLLFVLNMAMMLLERFTRFRSEPVQAKKILVLRTAALGDFILSIPALRRIRAAHPAAKITLLTTATTDRATLATVVSYAKSGNPWLELLPSGLIDEVLLFPFVGSTKSLIKDSRRLLGGKTFDVSFMINEGIVQTLDSMAKKICFLRLIGIDCQIYGFQIRAYTGLFPKIQQGQRRLEHHVLAIMRSVEESRLVAHSPAPPITFGLTVTEEANLWAKAKLAELGCQPSNLIIVAPGSRLEFKRWGSSGFVEVIFALLARSRVSVILVGSGPEAGTAELVQRECLALLGKGSRLYNLAGRTTIMELAALLSQAAVFLGNDGGTCHLAAAVGCRVASIGNGAEIPNSVEPWDNQRFTARVEVPCAPCYSFTSCPKNDNICVSRISSKLVQQRVEEALNESMVSGLI